MYMSIFLDTYKDRVRVQISTPQLAACGSLLEGSTSSKSSEAQAALPQSGSFQKHGVFYSSGLYMRDPTFCESSRCPSSFETLKLLAWSKVYIRDSQYYG